MLRCMHGISECGTPRKIIPVIPAEVSPARLLGLSLVFFGFADKANADDMIIERDGAKVAIDEASQPFLAGSEIDFVEEIIGAAFRVHNPNATSACGCGTSFSV